MQTVMARGYAGATTKQIAEAAGISEVTLFRKYGNKATLLAEAINAMLAEANLSVTIRYTGDLVGDLMRVVEAYQATSASNGLFIAIMLTELPRFPDQAPLLEAPFSIIRAIGELLARYQAEGQLQEEEPLHAVAALMGPLIGLNLMRSSGLTSAVPPLDVAAHVERFLAGHARLR